MPRARGHAGWDEYWAADRPASCVPEDAATTSLIAAFWIERLADLPDGARVLDVATGNGVVLAYAAEAARRASRGVALTGVDLAAIDPLRHLVRPDPALRAARFVAGVAAEKLPFAVASFDCVTSQYGLEYADLPQALAEAARVLAPGGRLRWLAHGPGSDVVAQNVAQRMEVDYLLSADGPYRAMRRFVAALRSPGALPAATAALRGAFVAAEEWCRAHPPARVVRQVCGEFVVVAERWQAYRTQDLESMLADGERRLRNHRLRIDDLASAVLTPARVDTVRRLLAAPGWRNVSTEPVHIGATESPIGVWVTAERAD